MRKQRLLTLIMIIYCLIHSNYVNAQDSTLAVIVNEEYQDAIQSKLNELGIKFDFPGDISTNSTIFVFSNIEASSILVIPAKLEMKETKSLVSWQYMDSVTPNRQTVTYTMKKDTQDSQVKQLLVDTAVFIISYFTGQCEATIDHFDETLEAIQSLTLRPEFTIWEVDLLPFIAFYAGNCALLNERYEQAATYFETSLLYDIRPKSLHGETPGQFQNYVTATNLAWTYLKLEREEDAFDLMNHILVENPFGSNEFEILLRRSQLYVLNGQFDPAIQDLDHLIEKSATFSTSQLPYFHTLRGQMYLALYEWDSALADYNMAIELDPEYADAYYERGVLYYSILQTGIELRTDALADFQHYLELAPDGEKAEDAARYIEQIETELEALNR
jgi:tetratricopeptide (TPR) repeat protein